MFQRRKLTLFHYSTLLTMLIVCVGAVTSSPVQAEYPDAYDVVWDTPSHDSSGSMPLGNGDIGVNVWVEPSGDLLFYISKTDAWSENARLLKLGRVRVTLKPSLAEDGVPFEQRLRLRDGVIEVRLGKAENVTTLRLWVDANCPVVRFDADAARPVDLDVCLEVWRDRERTITGGELDSAYGLMESPGPVVEGADTVWRDTPDQIVWFHRNTRSIWRSTLDLQGMGSWAEQAKDPLLNRTFGGLIEGPGMVSAGVARLKSASPAQRHSVAVHLLAAQTASEGEFIDRVRAQAKRSRAADTVAAFDAHRAWWRAFWDRSRIDVSGAPEAEIVSRGYALQRFITACGGRGGSPVKFNGSIFTVDAREEKRQFNADYRAWGGPYWFQNTRLIYWPLLASGDFEMFEPLFRMYLDALPFAEARTERYFGHDGAFFPETMYFWGAYANDNYGWNREGKSVGITDNRYIRYYYSGALELLALMLDYADYADTAGFVSGTLLPFADSVLRFYNKHYERDAHGKIRFAPAQSLETHQDAVNPLPEIAGLRFVVDGLNRLPEGVAGIERRSLWKRLGEELPELPMGQVEGKKVLLSAQEILEEPKNSENPELYAVFPYRLYGVGKPALDIGRWTFENRRVKGNEGWRQDDTQAALLGLTDTAREYVAKRFANKNPGSRFPAFWGPNFDWIPDQDHGCSGMIALQKMLMQCEGKKILLLPAWPKDWDVEFKLYAPYKTVVSGLYRGGKMERLDVVPAERRGDVVEMGAR